MRKLLLAALLLMSVANAALAADLQTERLATKVVQLSGIERSLTSLPETLTAQKDLLALTQPSGEKSGADAALSAFEPEAAKRKLIRHLADNCDADSLSKTIAWLESPLGMKMTAAEDAEKGLALQAGMLKFLSELKQNPPSQERIALVRQFVRESGQLEMVAKVFESTAVRMASAIAGGGAEVEAFARAKFKDLWIPLEKQFLQQLSVSNLYIYRNVPDSDLAAYLDFLRSEAGKRYTKAVLEGYGQIVEELVFATQKDLIEGIKKQAAGQQEDEDCAEDGDDQQSAQ